MSLITRNVVYRGYKISKSSINLPEVAKFGRIQVRLPWGRGLQRQRNHNSCNSVPVIYNQIFSKFAHRFEEPVVVTRVFETVKRS